MKNKNSSFYLAVHEVIQTGHWITDQISLELKEFGVSEPQFNVLRILRGQKGTPITVQEILEQMVQRSSNVTRIVDKLLSKGLVSRQECATNRRKMDIAITAEGLVFLQKLDKKIHAFYRPIINNLSSEEADTLTNLIKKLKEIKE